MASNNHNQSQEDLSLTKDDKLNTLNKFVKNLEVLSEVKEYDKLTVDSYNQLTVDGLYYTQGIVRRLYGNGREVTINAIEQLVDEIFEYTDTLLNNEHDKRKKNKLNISYSINPNMLNNTVKDFKDTNTDILNKLIENLETSTKGLQNLKVTFLIDTTVTFKLDLLIPKIKNKFTTVKKMIKKTPF